MFATYLAGFLRNVLIAQNSSIFAVFLRARIAVPVPPPYISRTTDISDP
jgi:hypothetical protein